MRLFKGIHARDLNASRTSPSTMLPSIGLGMGKASLASQALRSQP